MKTCIKCGEAKPLTEFYKNKRNSDGHDGRCKECAIAYVLGWQRANREKVYASNNKRTRTKEPQKRAAYASAIAAGLIKQCNRCGIDKPVCDFPFHRAGDARGAAPYCKPCGITLYKEWRARNPEKARAARKRASQRYAAKSPQRQAAHARQIATRDRQALGLKMIADGLTQTEVALELGVDISTVCHWVHGRRGPGRRSA